MPGGSPLPAKPPGRSQPTDSGSRLQHGVGCLSVFRNKRAASSEAAPVMLFRTDQPFREPIMTPVTKYFCTKG